ncbi:MAG: hypothetical protein J0I70_14005 [Microbacterium sp.]|uniref:DUF6492 family protein n=1 Tax=Microbacterium sp. TaxID=51671 RepID=UPI001AD003D7|nr:DUF6492 family protein [Microbacterium sp.]MBN9154315.1 hypothetical protein [Microbacterium sp.]MBN9175255.1 hypothetical protein [Microbacterium sp.]
MGDAPLTVVAVTYRAEDELLRVQARSLASFAPPGLIERIIVIDNGLPRLHGRRRAALLRDYGHLADLVRIIPADALAATEGSSGWVGQQVMKLTVADHVETPWYVVLDAKNHAVRPLVPTDLIGPDGRARGGFHDYAAHPLRDRLGVTLRYLGLDESATTRFPPTSTPFVLHTQTVRDLTASFDGAFAEEFIRAGLSEFFLYSGWILRRDGDWDRVYDGVAIQCPTLWGGAASTAGITAALDELSAKDAPFFGVHRRALGRLSASDFALIAAFWVQTGLMRSLAEARRLRRRFRRDLALSLLRTRLRSLTASLRPGAGHRG